MARKRERKEKESEKNDRKKRVKMILKEIGLHNSSSSQTSNSSAGSNRSLNNDETFTPIHERPSFSVDDKTVHQSHLMKEFISLSQKFGPKSVAECKNRPKSDGKISARRPSVASIKIADNVEEELELRNAAKKVMRSQAIEGKGKGIAVYNSSSSSSSDTDDQRNGDSATKSFPLINDASEIIHEHRNLMDENECADNVGEQRTMNDNDLSEENDGKMKVPKGKSLDLKLYFWWRKEVQALHQLANPSREAFLDCVGNA